LGGLLVAARRRGMTIARLDMRNSGDTDGLRDRVVGYGSWVLVEPAEERWGEPALAWVGPAVIRPHPWELPEAASFRNHYNPARDSVRTA